MIRYQMKSETEQLNLRADRKLLKRLQELTDRFNKRSKAAVAVEIIEQYIDFWETSEKAKFEVIERQRNLAQITDEEINEILRKKYQVSDTQQIAVLKKPVE